MVSDPVCGMEVKEDEAAAQGEHEGVTYYFCSAWCKEEFEKDPKKYLEGRQEQ